MDILISSFKGYPIFLLIELLYYNWHWPIKMCPIFPIFVNWLLYYYLWIIIIHKGRLTTLQVTAVTGISEWIEAIKSTTGKLKAEYETDARWRPELINLWRQSNPVIALTWSDMLNCAIYSSGMIWKLYRCITNSACKPCICVHQQDRLDVK